MQGKLQRLDAVEDDSRVEGHRVGRVQGKLMGSAAVCCQQACDGSRAVASKKADPYLRSAFLVSMRAFTKRALPRDSWCLTFLEEEEFWELPGHLLRK